MPFSRCPTCSATFHLNVSDVEAWYKARWPLLPVGAEVPEECVDCWKKRVGHPVEPEARAEPYTRAEIAQLGDVLPARGAMCPKCRAVIPRFVELDPAMETRLRELWRSSRPMAAVAELRAATGCTVRWAKLWLQHPHGPEMHAWSKGGPCWYCGEPLRSPLARQCVDCGMDWHDARRVLRNGQGRHFGELRNLADVDGLRFIAIGPGDRPPVIVRDLKTSKWVLTESSPELTLRPTATSASFELAINSATSTFGIKESDWAYFPPPPNEIQENSANASS